MLAQLIIIALLVSAVSITGAETMATYAKAKTATSQNASAATVLQAGQAQALASLRTQISGGTTTLDAPVYDPISLCANATPVCNRTATVTYSFSGSSTFAPNAVADGAQVSALNTQSLVNEGRVALNMAVTISDSNVPVAHRSQLLTFQTETTDPYATVVGVLDTNGSSAVQTVGDIAGCDPSNPTACDSGATGPATDTRITINATCTGDPTECAYAQPPASSFTNQTYVNSDAATGAFQR